MKMFDEIRGAVKTVVGYTKAAKEVYDYYHNFTDEQIKELLRTAPRRKDTQVTKEWR